MFFNSRTYIRFKLSAKINGCLTQRKTCTARRRGCTEKMNFHSMHYWLAFKISIRHHKNLKLSRSRGETLTWYNIDSMSVAKAIFSLRKRERIATKSFIRWGPCIKDLFKEFILFKEILIKDLFKEILGTAIKNHSQLVGFMGVYY